MEDYSHHMGYMHKEDRMTNSYSIACGNGPRNCSSMLDPAILNSYILLSLCSGKKVSHKEFWFSLVRNKLAQAGQQPRVQRPLWTPANGTNKVGTLVSSGNKHWPDPANQLQCRAYSAHGAMQKVNVKCLQCEGGLCMDKTRFLDYHTKVQL